MTTLMAPAKRMADILAAAPWRPPSGAGIEVGEVHGHRHIAILCAHQIMFDSVERQVELIGDWERTHPKCPLDWVRYYFEPPAKMVGMFNVSAKLGAPADVVNAVTAANVMAASVRTFLEENPPTACGCEPGLELVIGRPKGTGPGTLRLCHEKWCAHVGKPPARQHPTAFGVTGDKGPN